MYVCPPLLPLFLCWQLLVGREESLQWNEALSFQLLLPSTAAVRQPPVLTPWGSQEGAKATEGSTRKGK